MFDTQRCHHAPFVAIDHLAAIDFHDDATGRLMGSSGEVQIELDLGPRFDEVG